MSESLLLRDATVQEIQLELIRRTNFNAFDGEQIYASLMKHRSLWQAVILDRLGAASYSRPGKLFTAGLIKLRDIDGNYWNADQLFILTTKREQAIELARIIQEEDWGSDKPRIYDEEEMDNAVMGYPGLGLISMWWD